LLPRTVPQTRNWASAIASRASREGRVRAKGRMEAEEDARPGGGQGGASDASAAASEEAADGAEARAGAWRREEDVWRRAATEDDEDEEVVEAAAATAALALLRSANILCTRTMCVERVGRVVRKRARWDVIREPKRNKNAPNLFSKSPRARAPLARAARARSPVP
jgi:hypothetical protein